MAEVTECTAADQAEFWGVDGAGATETGKQAEYVVESTLIHCAGCEALARMQEGVNRMRVRAEVTQATYVIPPSEATERELRAYLAAAKDEQEGK